MERTSQLLSRSWMPRLVSSVLIFAVFACSINPGEPQPPAVITVVVPENKPEQPPAQAEEPPPDQPTVTQSAQEHAQPAVEPKDEPPPIEEPPAVARMYNFYACLTECLPDGSNSARIFPEQTEKVYLRWSFENIPPGASYQRIWTWGGMEWARYNCAWPGPTSGVDAITLTEPYGLRSGIWTVKIVINGEVLLTEQLNFLGNHDYWDPVGTLQACYGKVPSRPMIPQACGMTEATVDYGPISLGTMVILDRHRAVNGDDNWNNAMDPFVGKRGVVEQLSGVDGEGCPVAGVDLDGGKWAWRIRDMQLP